MRPHENGGFDPKTWNPTKLLFRRIVATVLMLLVGFGLSPGGGIVLIPPCSYCLYLAYRHVWLNDRFISKAHTGSETGNRGKVRQKKTGLKVVPNMLLASNLFKRRMPSTINEDRILTAIIGIGFRLAAQEE